jgi:phthiocerol/phenolphthiocerol synthesis type-I polyketide synthase E
MTARDPADAVAIVGMAGRFPGAADVEQFWNNLQAGVESIRRPSDDELEGAGVSPAVRAHREYVRAGTLVDGFDQFAAEFFDVTTREAEILDPQQRVFLECVWEALENAGHDPTRCDGPVGVYAAAGSHDYAIWHLYANPDVVRSVGHLQIMLGNDADYMATRVSYKLGLCGPSVTVHTACSGSLVAVHLACESLLSGECDLAIAGAASIRLPQNSGYVFVEGGILSRDGHCRAFDAGAGGTVFGSGAGVVVLKRLGEAVGAGDAIRAVILGSAVNNDGAGKVGYTAPSVAGQAEVIALAQAVAGVAPESISYVEGHGTGTPLGDPIEVEALRQAFGSGGRGYCALGSVKTNVGHLEAAAGMAGLIKTVLSLEREAIPASLHFERPNPRIDFAGSPFYVNAALRPWPRSATPRRAGVSSFGIGGTNAHVVVEEAPVRGERPADGAAHLVVVSGRTVAERAAAGDRLAAYLRAHPEVELRDVAYTLQAGRRHCRYRRMLVATACAEVAERLTTGREVEDGDAGAAASGGGGGRAAAEPAGAPEAAALTARGRAWLQGRPLGAPVPAAAAHGRRIPLPTYPFTRHRYWIDPPASHHASVAALLGAPGTAQKYAEADLTRQIGLIWEDVLGTAVSDTDSFVELGGDSALAVMVVSKAREAGIPIKVEDLVAGTTVADLAAAAVRLQHENTS